MRQMRRDEASQLPARRTNWTIISLIIGLIFLLLTIISFAGAGKSDQDRLTNVKVTNLPMPVRDKLCSSSKIFDLIKQELFRRAAKVRGTDQSAFDRLSGFAVARMDNPVMESQDETTAVVNCSGSLSIDLPPGIAVTGGRQTLTSALDYKVTVSADQKTQSVAIRNGDTIVDALATVAQINPPADPSSQVAPANDVASETQAATPETMPQRIQAQTQPTPVRPQSKSPENGCTAARPSEDLGMCNNSELASLDRQLAAQYARAFALASPEQRDSLRQTSRRFEDFRGHCTIIACVVDADQGRMQEIRDIMEGR